MLSRFSPAQWKKIACAALVLTALILGIVTLYRSCGFDGKIRTDLTVYLRAGKAILQNENIYAVENERHWHYVYLPLLAIMMSPFVILPLFVNAALWYLLSVTAVFAAFRGLQTLYDSRERSFWFIFAAFLLAFPPLLNGMVRGQLGAISLFLIVLVFLLDRAKRYFWAGFMLAFAIVLKMSPLLILPFYFLIRRNWKAVLGGLCGGILFGLIVPFIFLGIPVTFEYLGDYYHAVSGATGPQSWRSYLWGELFTPFSEDNQSFYGIMTRLVWQNQGNFMTHYHPGIKTANFSLIFILLGALTFVFAKKKNTTADFCFFALLSCVMLFTSPVSEPHHFTPMMLLGAAAFLIIEKKPQLMKPLAAIQIGSGLAFILGLAVEPLAWIGLPFWGVLTLWLSILFASRKL